MNDESMNDEMTGWMMDEWWMNGSMNEWMTEWMNAWMHECIDAWMNG